MSNRSSVALLLLGLSLIFGIARKAYSGQASPTNAASVPPQGENHCLSAYSFALPIDARTSTDLVNEYSNGTSVILLLTHVRSIIAHPPLDCGRVEAILDLSHLMRPGEVAYFKCSVQGRGRTEWGRVVGVGDNHKGKLRFIVARRAWRISVKEKRFGEIRGQKVTCDTTGYDDYGAFGFGPDPRI